MNVLTLMLGWSIGAGVVFVLVGGALVLLARFTGGRGEFGPPGRVARAGAWMLGFGVALFASPLAFHWFQGFAAPSTGQAPAASSPAGGTVWSTAGRVLAAVAMVAAGAGALLVGFRAGAVTARARRSAAGRRLERAEIAAEWAAVHEIEQVAATGWTAADADLAVLLAAPVLRDFSDPVTAAARQAFDALRDLSRPQAPRKASRVDVAAYRGVVEVFADAVARAVANAETVGVSRLDAGGQRRVERARRLLAIALDQAATPSERQVAYRRARAELNGLMVIPQAAAERIEAAIRASSTMAP